MKRRHRKIRNEKLPVKLILHMIQPKAVSQKMFNKQNSMDGVKKMLVVMATVFQSFCHQ